MLVYEKRSRMIDARIHEIRRCCTISVQGVALGRGSTSTLSLLSLAWLLGTDVVLRSPEMLAEAEPGILLFRTSTT